MISTTEEWAHPIDEPCPPCCPTRSAEIAAAFREWSSAYGGISVTAEVVDRVLAEPPAERNDLGRIIAQFAGTWV